MAHTTRYTVRYRRRREGKTNYQKRLELLKGRKERLIIRKSNTQIILQIATYHPDGDKVLVTVKSSELKKKGWKYSTKNIPAAYLAGLMLAKKAKEHNIKEAVLDMGLQTPIHGNKIFAALKGVVDGGLNVPFNESIFPKQERISGQHIANHLDKFKGITADFEKLKSELSK